MATLYSDNAIGIVKMAAAAFPRRHSYSNALFRERCVVRIALAIILSFVLAPLTRLFQGWGLPRSPSVITVVFVAFAVTFGLAGVIASEIGQLAGNLPHYQTTMEQKIATRTGTTRTLERAADVLQNLRVQINKPKTLQGAIQNEAGPPELEPRPVPVEFANHLPAF
jgi:predicted PurR-regulated permease PerM